LKGAGAFGAFAFGRMAALAASDAAPDLLSRALAFGRGKARQDELIAAWDAATRLVTPDVYKAYCLDGDTRGFKALKARTTLSTEFCARSRKRSWKVMPQRCGAYTTWAT
jgi:hypothetical protein